MTSVQKKLRALEKRRKRAALIGAGVGLSGGFLASFDIAVTLLAGVAASLMIWYFASLSYWEYRDFMTLKRRNR